MTKGIYGKEKFFFISIKSSCRQSFNDVLFFQKNFTEQDVVT